MAGPISQFDPCLGALIDEAKKHPDDHGPITEGLQAAASAWMALVDAPSEERERVAVKASTVRPSLSRPDVVRSPAGVLRCSRGSLSHPFYHCITDLAVSRAEDRSQFRSVIVFSPMRVAVMEINGERALG
jgi:hypothetical protein